MSDWKRLGVMNGKDSKLFHGGTEAADTQQVRLESFCVSEVVQGSLGDCWLIAAMSAVAGNLYSL